MDAQLRALTDPTRRAILHQLGAGEQPAGVIAKRFAVSRPAISHHLGVLREARLVTVRHEGQSRLYSVNADAVTQLRKQFNAFWDDALPRLKTVVETGHTRRRAGDRSRD